LAEIVIAAGTAKKERGKTGTYPAESVCFIANAQNARILLVYPPAMVLSMASDRVSQPALPQRMSSGGVDFIFSGTNTLSRSRTD